MSLPEQEAYALRRAWEFLLGLSSGKVKLDRVTPVREEARDIVKHFPLGGVPSAETAEAAHRERRDRRASD